MFRNLKNRLRRRRLARDGFTEELDCTKSACGSGDGSWVVHPDTLDAQSVIYSFGIGRDLSLEQALIKRHGCSVHAFDPTPVALEWARRQALPDSLVIHDYGVANFDGVLEFHLPRKASGAHFSPVRRYKNTSPETLEAPVKRLSTILPELGHDRIDLLKIDIEGGEYNVIDDFLADEIHAGQLLVEFHHNYATIDYQQTRDTLGRLKQEGYRIFSISERSYEISMLKG